MTPKRRRFVEEYLIDLNATQAAIRAGFKRRAAYSQGQRLLKDVEVTTAIHAAQQEQSARTQVTADRVIAELARIALLDPRRLYDWGPGGVSVKPSDTLDEDDARAVGEVSQTITKDGGGTIRVKPADKVAALKLLGQHLGMFTEKVEHSGGVNGTLTTILIQPKAALKDADGHSS